MKKVLFTVVATLIISSCTTGNDNDEATFVVKFKDGTEVKVVGTDASVGKNGFYIEHKGTQTSVFAKDEVLYILKEQ